MFESITASEIAGFGVGALLLGATISAPRIDSLISSSQRSSLSMCRRCGDLRMIACSKCKGFGSVKEGGPLSFNMMDGLFQSLEDDSNVRTVSCTICRARGHFRCPECSKLPQN